MNKPSGKREKDVDVYKELLEVISNNIVNLNRMCLLVVHHVTSQYNPQVILLTICKEVYNL